MDASKVWEEHTGDEYDDGGEWIAEPDDAMLTIYSNGGRTRTMKTCAEWATAEGRGFIGSEY